MARVDVSSPKEPSVYRDLPKLAFEELDYPHLRLVAGLADRSNEISSSQNLNRIDIRMNSDENGQFVIPVDLTRVRSDGERNQ